MSKKLMLYGANGYTSRLIIKELVGQNIKPVLAGRNQEKINSLADKHGFQFCIFSLNGIRDAHKILRYKEDLYYFANAYDERDNKIREAKLSEMNSIRVEKIEPFMTFGKMPLANGFLRKEDFDRMTVSSLNTFCLNKHIIYLT